MDILAGIKEALTDAFGDDIDLDSIVPGADLREDLGFNSIGLLAMAVSLEEKFGFSFNNDDFTGIKTVGDVVDVIAAKIA